MVKVDVNVVLLGQDDSGKTSLFQHFLHGRVDCGPCGPTPTIGASYHKKQLDVFGHHVYLGIWDTAGTERCQAMIKLHYRNAWAAIICYDLTDISSWQKAQFWVEELRRDEPTCRVYLCGTKSDFLEHDSALRRDSYDRMVKEFASAVILPFASSEASEALSSRIFETSSKTGEGVEEMFMQVAQDSVKESKERPSSSPWEGSDAPFSLNSDRSFVKEDSCCKCC